MHSDAAKSVSEGVVISGSRTAGGRVKFKTNSPYVRIRAETLKCPLASYEISRREVIKETYETAKSQGDNNVYFIDGCEMMRFKDGNEAAADNCRPTDLGFRRMADSIGEAVGKALKK